MSGSRNFCSEKTILILYKRSRGGPLFSGVGGGQASKYLKIGTCPASQKLLTYIGKK